MVVFVCSPYAGDIDGNTERARNYCRQEYEMGNTPFAPHLLYPQFLSEDTERFDGLAMGLEMLSLCDEVHVYGEQSPGMKMEIEQALSIGKPIMFMRGF